MPFGLGCNCHSIDDPNHPNAFRYPADGSRVKMHDLNCDLSHALQSLQGSPNVESFVLVDAPLPVELAPPSPYSAPVLAAAGVARACIPPYISTKLKGIYKLDPTTGHPAQQANTVTKVAQRELLRSVRQGECINAATLCAHLLRAAYQLGWQSAPVLSQVLVRKGDGKPCFAFVPLGPTGEEMKMVTTSGNSQEAVCAKAALVRQYVHAADEDGISHIFAEIARKGSVPRELLDKILEVVSIHPTRPTEAGGCEVIFKVDPGLFYCLPRVPGFEFVEWGSEVDAGRATKRFEWFGQVDEAVRAERMFAMECRVDDEEIELLD